MKSIRKLSSNASWIDLLKKPFLSEKSAIYDNCPLASMSPSKRGMLIQRFVQKYYHHHIAQTSPLIKNPMNGAYGYDFHDIDNNKRVEVKSASVLDYMDKGNPYQKLFFRHVNPQKFDRLTLIGYQPMKQVIMWDWDGVTGLVESGMEMKTKGYNLLVPLGKGFNNSLEYMNQKPGEVLFQCLPEDVAIMDYETHVDKMYKNSPLINMSPPKTALLLQNLARTVWIQYLGDQHTVIENGSYHDGFNFYD